MPEPIIIINGIIGLSSLVFLVIYYNSTKEYSGRYKSKTKTIARAIIGINLINSIIIQYLSGGINILFIGSISIGILIGYAVIKGELRTAQALSDINFLRGSSYLKGKFKLKEVDWKLIIKINILLFIWTLIVFGFGKPEINPLLAGEGGEESHWVFTIINFIAIFFVAPIREEISYRFFGVNLFLHWLGKGKISRVISIFVPTIIWVSLHSGLLTNNWLKYIQILPLGLACGYVLYKKDIEHSILIHMIFNVMGMVVALIVF